MAWTTQATAAGRAVDLGLLEIEGGWARASARGWELLDTLLAEFLPER